jgi:hypothetical protein
VEVNTNRAAPPRTETKEASMTANTRRIPGAVPPLVVPVTVVPLAEAAARTGLADDVPTMRAVLAGSPALVAVGSGTGVDLAALAGGVVEVQIGDVVVLESGVLA